MLLLAKRYCVEYVDGSRECFREDGFWYSDKGVIVKWAILIALFVIFIAWFMGGYLHAKQRLRAGKPLLAYHRFLVPYSVRRSYGQAGPPQNHFSFYQTPNPYAPRHDGGGAWAEPPPQYMGSDQPPQYYAPPPQGAAKMHPAQPGMEMPVYAAGPQGGQQSGVVGSSSVEAGEGSAQPGQTLPPRPPQAAKARILGALQRFRK